MRSYKDESEFDSFDRELEDKLKKFLYVVIVIIISSLLFYTQLKSEELTITKVVNAKCEEFKEKPIRIISDIENGNVVSIYEYKEFIKKETVFNSRESKCVYFKKGGNK